MSQLFRVGSSGQAIVELQRALNAALRRSASLETDGKFGPNTLNAVRAFQSEKSLKVDGIVGPQTVGLCWRRCRK